MVGMDSTFSGYYWIVWPYGARRNTMSNEYYPLSQEVIAEINDDYPAHSRVSCSDFDPCNAEPSGMGCWRCNALLFADYERVKQEYKLEITDHEEEVKKLKEEIKELHEALQNAANSLDSAGREWDASNAWRYLNKHPELIRQRGAQ